jgi:hypothetical protein
MALPRVVRADQLSKVAAAFRDVREIAWKA